MVGRVTLNTSNLFVRLSNFAEKFFFQVELQADFKLIFSVTLDRSLKGKLVYLYLTAY